MTTLTDPWNRKPPVATACTNGQAIRAGLVPCETNPTYGGLSRTTQPFHCVAEVTVGSRGERRHVCRDCAERHHKHQLQIGGIRWE